MGNIGLSQGLAPLVAAFGADAEMRRARARMVITGGGVAEGEVRQAAQPDLVEMPGLVSDQRLEEELERATLGVVTQRYDGSEFNLPSKLMNYMAYGLPVIAAVNPSSEAARLVRESGGGWVADSPDPELFPRTVAEALGDAEELERRRGAALEFAHRHFTCEAFANAFERALLEAVAGRRRAPG
jgi:colanic acid biosynthesis glycosyl transferase WcaI